MALRQHDRWLRTVVYSRVGGMEGVDDVMQEVALAAVRHAATLPDADRLAPWLYRVAVRQSLLYRRKAGRRRKLTSGYAAEKPPAEHDESRRNHSTGCWPKNGRGWCGRHWNSWHVATGKFCC